MKQAIISDLHFEYSPNKPYSQKIINNNFKTLDYFFDECLRRKISHIDILGDLFDFKDKVHPLVLIPTMSYFDHKIKTFPYKLNVSAIPGNHDIFLKDNASINFARVFEKIFNVYSEYTVVEKETFALHYLPYVQDYMVKDVVLKPVKNKKNILLTHLCLHELFDKWEDVRYVVSPKFFIEQGMDRIYSGHIHIHADLGDIVYVSSPNMSNFGEIEDKGRFGFMFLDYENLAHEFVPNPHSPNFYKFTLTKEILPEILKTTDSFITLTIEHEVKQDFLVKLLANLREKNYDVKVKYHIEKKNTSISIIKDWEETELITPDKIDEMYLDYVKMDEEKKAKYLDYIKEVSK